MLIEQLKVGMDVVPVRSTHPNGSPMTRVKEYGLRPDGTLRVCDIDRDSDGNWTVYLYRNRIHTAYGNDMTYSCKGWKWYKFRPEDLEKVTTNRAWFAKIRREL
jgi:hypothetical protein